MARTPKRQKRFSATASLSTLELAKNTGTAISVSVREKEKLGTLEIGQGSVRWFAADAKKGKRYSWSRFARLMETGK